MINVVWAVDIAATWLTPAKKLLPKKIFPLKEEISCTYPKIINFSNDKAKFLPKKNSHLPEKNDFPPKEKIYHNYSPLKKLISLMKKFLTLIQKIFSIFWMKNYYICLKINQSFLYLPRKQFFKIKFIMLVQKKFCILAPKNKFLCKVLHCRCTFKSPSVCWNICMKNLLN